MGDRLSMCVATQAWSGLVSSELAFHFTEIWSAGWGLGSRSQVQRQVTPERIATRVSDGR